MKKERNCSGNMQMPMYGVGMPVPMPPAPPVMMPYATQTTSTSYGSTYNNMEQQMNNMQQQINMLENRVSKLEGKTSTNYTNNYNDSNYYML